ncbi:MAG: hypothetical protein H7175_19150 [Burkholderiales bacterium]|nr:hypothetical protein [Anaerolineae bacterium]
MGSTLIVNSTSSWMPGGGTFDPARLYLAAKVQPENSTLATFLREPIDDPYIDFSPLSQQEFKLILQAVVEMFGEVFNCEHPQFPNPLHVNRLSELKAMLILDPRSEVEIATCSLLIRSNSSWVVPCWIYNVALEQILSTLKLETLLPIKQQESLFERIQLGLQTVSECDLTSLDEDELRAIYYCIDTLYRRYGDSGDGRGNISVSIPFLASFAPRIVELHEMFKALLAT